MPTSFLPGSASYRETVATAADVARSLGDGERLALAVLGHARHGGFAANTTVVDEGLLALYEEASAALGNADSLLRALVLGQLGAGEAQARHRHGLDLASPVPMPCLTASLIQPDPETP